MFMNEYEIDKALDTFGEDTPNLRKGATLLSNLRDYANSCSDGWAYWPKPSRAANRLVISVMQADPFDPQDITDAQLTAALKPIKAFLTRHGVNHASLGF